MREYTRCSTHRALHGMASAEGVWRRFGADAIVPLTDAGNEQ